jgi:hypothetical protein
MNTTAIDVNVQAIVFLLFRSGCWCWGWCATLLRTSARRRSASAYIKGYLPCVPTVVGWDVEAAVFSQTVELVDYQKITTRA